MYLSPCQGGAVWTQVWRFASLTVRSVNDGRRSRNRTGILSAPPSSISPFPHSLPFPSLPSLPPSLPLLFSLFPFTVPSPR